jgi:hypothetical protein
VEHVTHVDAAADERGALETFGKSTVHSTREAATG